MILKLFLTSFIKTGLTAMVGVLYAAAGAIHIQDAHQHDSHFGSIEGYVFNAEGRPASRFTVYAEKVDSERGLTFTTRTDKDGSYRLEKLQTGAYIIYAGKESAGYPENLAAIYLGVVKYAKVVVRQEEVTREVTLVLGPKLGILSGRVEDFSTKKPVVDASITFRLEDNQAYFSTINVDSKGQFKFIAPLASFTIEVSALGYEEWASTNTGINQRMEPIQISSGAVKELTVNLRSMKLNKP